MSHDEVRKALEDAREALGSVWAAIGDALCSGKSIEKAYANSVAAECRNARDRINKALAGPRESATAAPPQADEA
jgi:hypothetical protein